MIVRLLKIISVLVVIFSFAVGIAAYSIWQDMQAALAKPLPIDKPVLFEVPSGMNVRQLSEAITANGWLREAFFFEIEARRLKVAHLLKAGTYEFAPGDTPLTVLDKITAGQTATFSVRFIEGMSAWDILQVIADAPHVVTTLEGLEPDQIAAKLDIPQQSLEGWIFPSTYHYDVKSSDLALLERAYEKMQTVLTALWQKRQENLPYESPYDALIMASIIEKETGQADERKQIAGVFVRRLEKGMKLQTDPTVIYGLGDKFDGNLRRKDLRTDTLYNTYTRHGLPPTPIAMPGADSIEAALQPAPGNALYFVAKGNGRHAFSATLQEHNVAVRKYQLKK